MKGSTAARPGSRLGKPNRRTLAGQALVRKLEEGDGDLPPALERWKALLTDRDAGVRLRAEMFLFEFLHGSGRKTGPADIPEVRLILTPDPRPVASHHKETDDDQF